MPLDGQLRSAFHRLADRLHEDVTAHAAGLVDELLTAAEGDRADAVAAAARDAWSAAERETSARVTSSNITARADVRRLETAATEKLLAGIQAIDGGQSLSEIMHALVDGASDAARRVALFLVKDARLQGWRTSGFDDLGLDADFDLAIADEPLLREAVRSGGAATQASAPEFALLPPERPAVAIPLTMSGQVFAVLYADQGPSGEIARESWRATVEVLTRHAARSLEAITASKMAQASVARTRSTGVGTRFGVSAVSST